MASARITEYGWENQKVRFRLTLSIDLYLFVMAVEIIEETSSKPSRIAGMRELVVKMLRWNGQKVEVKSF
jgi:hypothetical protein